MEPSKECRTGQFGGRYRSMYTSHRACKWRHGQWWTVLGDSKLAERGTSVWCRCRTWVKIRTIHPRTWSWSVWYTALFGSLLSPAKKKKISEEGNEGAIARSTDNSACATCGRGVVYGWRINPSRWHCWARKRWWTECGCHHSNQIADRIAVWKRFPWYKGNGLWLNRAKEAFGAKEIVPKTPIEVPRKPRCRASDESLSCKCEWCIFNNGVSQCESMFHFNSDEVPLAS